MIPSESKQYTSSTQYYKYTINISPLCGDHAWTDWYAI